MSSDNQDTPEASPDSSSDGQGARDLIESLIHETEAAREQAATGIERFLHEPSVPRATVLWLGDRLRADRAWDWESVSTLLQADIAVIDSMLNGMVNTILHHPDFQHLEASWRSLRYLVREAEIGENIKIKFLDCSWEDLVRDVERALDFDQSQIFRRVYEDEFGTPGGEPYGVLIGDYEIRHRVSADHPYNDLEVLGAMNGIAAAAFAPFIAGLHPAMLGLDSFGELGQSLNLHRTFEQTEYVKWKAYRDQADSRFVGLTLPKVLARLPYLDDGTRVDRFRFTEDVAGPDHRNYLWGNAAYCFASVLIRSFANYGWLANIRGINRGEDGGGLVTGVPVHYFGTDKSGIAAKMSTEVDIDDYLEKELSDLGFIPLCHCKYTEYLAFHSNQSTQKPVVYDTEGATENAKLSAMLQYILCAGRFAHYLKVMARDKVGAFVNAAALESYLQDWIMKYVTANEDAGLELKARFPLREARVRVRERPGSPGSLMCEVHLQPHYQLETIASSMRLMTELTTQQGA